MYAIQCPHISSDTYIKNVRLPALSLIRERGAWVLFLCCVFYYTSHYTSPYTHKPAYNADAQRSNDLLYTTNRTTHSTTSYARTTNTYHTIPRIFACGSCVDCSLKVIQFYLQLTSRIMPFLSGKLFLTSPFTTSIVETSSEDNLDKHSKDTYGKKEGEMCGFNKAMY